MAIHLRSAEELEKMHRAGLFVHEVLTALRDAVKPGITTMDLEKMRAGNRLGDVGHAVQSWVEENGFSVVREFVGHGIGTKMHDEPNLPNYGDEGRGARLQEGMVIAVEPMVNAGSPEVRMRDEWVAETADGSPSAHFEHTVAVTANGPWILTRPKEMTRPPW